VSSELTFFSLSRRIASDHKILGTNQAANERKFWQSLAEERVAVLAQFEQAGRSNSHKASGNLKAAAKPEAKKKNKSSHASPAELPETEFVKGWFRN